MEGINGVMPTYEINKGAGEGTAGAAVCGLHGF